MHELTDVMSHDSWVNGTANISLDSILKSNLPLFNHDLNCSCLVKRNNRFQESYNVKYFKEINRLKSPQKAEAYLELKQASTRDVFYEYAYYFCKKAPS